MKTQKNGLLERQLNCVVCYSISWYLCGEVVGDSLVSNPINHCPTNTIFCTTEFVWTTNLAGVAQSINSIELVTIYYFYILLLNKFINYFSVINL